MYDVIIYEPMSLRVKVTEIDNYVPSFKTLMQIEISHPTGFFNYSASDVWFEYLKWQQFCSNLLSSNHIAILEDMSGYFKLSIERNKDFRYIIDLSCYEPEIGSGKTSISFSTIIDEDIFVRIKNTFVSYSPLDIL